MNAEPNLATWLNQLARDAGYDVDSPRGGGKAEIAEATGISRSQITRIFNGDSKPDINSQRALAKLLGADLREMLVRSGYVDADELPKAGDAPPPPIAALDLHAYAAKLGIPADRRHLFVRSVESLANEFSEAPEATIIDPHTQTGERSASEG